jgi:hypothetical protein
MLLTNQPDEHANRMPLAGTEMGVQDTGTARCVVGKGAGEQAVLGQYCVNAATASANTMKVVPSQARTPRGGVSRETTVRCFMVTTAYSAKPIATSATQMKRRTQARPSFISHACWQVNWIIPE